MKEKDTTTCLCRKMGCWRGDDEGTPSYCQANKYVAEIKKANEVYATPEVVDIYNCLLYTSPRPRDEQINLV